MTIANPASTRGAALYLALLQFFFALGWTIYVIYLPQLTAQVGIPKEFVVIILIVDQAVFTVTDTLMGIAADRMTRIAGHLSRFIIWLAAISCIAFLAMPFTADRGAAGKPVLIGLIATWVVTSSALRAPPMALLGKVAARPSAPWLFAIVMLGFGLAGAISPYLGVALRGIDPRLPFAISSLTLLTTAFAMGSVERRLRSDDVNTALRIRLPIPSKRILLVIALIAGVLLLALGTQFHVAINSVPMFLRFAKQPDLEWLMPVYWIGFNIAMFPASFITRRVGGLFTIGVAGLLGAGALLLIGHSASLNTMIVMQFIAGGAWGCVLMSAIALATALGHGGNEGRVLGLLFSALALATVARLTAVAAGFTRDAVYNVMLQTAPVVCWILAGAAILVLALARLRTRRGQTAVEY